MYNLTAINFTNPSVMVKTTSEILFFGWLGALFLITIMVILIIAYYQYTQEPKGALLYASFSTAIFSILFFVMQWINGTMLFTFCSIYVIMLLLNIFSNDSG